MPSRISDCERRDREWGLVWAGGATWPLGGMLYVASGYVGIRGSQGNVVLAFGLE
jgi:hypothetical protein